MPYLLYIFLILLSNFSIYAIDIDENSSNLSILDKASIFIDKNNSLSLGTIKEQTFIKNKLINLNLGYRPNEVLWIKFTLHNRTKTSLTKILEFAYKQTESVTLYNNLKILHGGFYHYVENRKSLKPSFTIELDTNESKIYYLKVKAKVKPLRATITL